MSGVHLAKSFPPSLGMPDVRAMQDVLYDILATGIDPEQSQIPLDAIERFLHEHARAAKSPEEFRTFFAQHGLTVSMRAVKPPPVALPPIQRANPDEAIAKFPVELARPEPLPKGLGFAQQMPGDPDLVMLAPRRTQPWLWAALIVLAGGVSALAYHGYTVITQLEHRLEQADSANRDHRTELEALQTKTAGLESNVAESSEQIQRVDDRNNMIIQSLITDQHKVHKGY